MQICDFEVGTVQVMFSVYFFFRLYFCSRTVVPVICPEIVDVKVVSLKISISFATLQTDWRLLNRSLMRGEQQKYEHCATLRIIFLQKY